MMERKTEARTVIQGVVVSDKNAKTIVVLVETHKRHSKYGKRVKYILIKRTVYLQRKL